ncbi:hypothetical protein P153DRAFT_391066 [Dothidotthia symphoricarpi CBS 119687]|uniref:Uncharacterized protein n=1 Tax=Dothidotthia symphoricarpi CBS 119687 TaxID=1392245 RepID=A0A6A5ZYR3_9PLEO|nr:uncharacterized protein P153DRAFT_391066 [Dothidotthia symphoricarpi CBS 119687]KAF2124034.1 hypothetical protein P153DRAFT_391066 [Dothidotthia symphoricarpi CBS 119687]
MGLAALGRYDTVVSGSSPRELCVGVATSKPLAEKDTSYSDSGFQTKVFQERKMALTRAKVQATILVIRYRSVAEKAGYRVWAEMQEDRVIHSEQFSVKVEFDDDGNATSHDVGGRVFSNIYGEEIQLRPASTNLPSQSEHQQPGKYHILMKGRKHQKQTSIVHCSTPPETPVSPAQGRSAYSSRSQATNSLETPSREDIPNIDAIEGYYESTNNGKPDLVPANVTEEHRLRAPDTVTSAPLSSQKRKLYDPTDFGEVDRSPKRRGWLEDHCPEKVSTESTSSEPFTATDATPLSEEAYVENPTSTESLKLIRSSSSPKPENLLVSQDQAKAYDREDDMSRARKQEERRRNRHDDAKEERCEDTQLNKINRNLAMNLRIHDREPIRTPLDRGPDDIARTREELQRRRELRYQAIRNREARRHTQTHPHNASDDFTKSSSEGSGSGRDTSHRRLEADNSKHAQHSGNQRRRVPRDTTSATVEASPRSTRKPTHVEREQQTTEIERLKDDIGTDVKRIHEVSGMAPTSADEEVRPRKSRHTVSITKEIHRSTHKRSHNESEQSAPKHDRTEPSVKPQRKVAEPHARRAPREEMARYVPGALRQSVQNDGRWNGGIDQRNGEDERRETKRRR